MEALRVEGLSRNFGGVQVLRDLSFSMESGEHLAIIGPNGAGKTTLIKVLIGELPATHGRVHFLGQEVTTMPTHRRIHLGLARSFQVTTLFPDLTVVTNTLLAVQGTKPSRFQMLRSLGAYQEINAKAQNVLESVGLWEKRDNPVKTIGYGEQRRLEIALTLASDPKMLLMDEPSAGLTVEESRHIGEMIHNLGADITALIVAHDMDLVFGVADRIMVLYYGQIVAQGTPQEVQANPKVREIYLGVEENDADTRCG